MSWYSVEIFLQSLHPDSPGNDWLWEQRVVLFDAADEAAAKVKAETFGRKEELEFVAAEGGRCQWKFIRIGDCQQLAVNDLQDGLELFHKFLKTEEVESISKPFEE